MYYYLYKITNLVNGKIYIGIHQTPRLDDGYMGSGSLIRVAQQKYGLENFKKEYLEFFDNRDEMLKMESVVVNENFVQQKDNYNIKVGGGTSHNAKVSDYYLSGDHRQNAVDALKLASNKQRELKQKRIEKYNLNPTLCTCCDIPLDYEKRRNKFCSSSCSATHNNKDRVVSEGQR